jgi:hypothetical protein
MAIFSSYLGSNSLKEVLILSTSINLLRGDSVNPLQFSGTGEYASLDKPARKARQST